MGDANVQHGSAVVKEAVRGEVALASIVVERVVRPPELPRRRVGNMEFIRL